MKDPEITAIERAMRDDPKIEAFLDLLLSFVAIDRECSAAAAQPGFTPNERGFSEGFPLADARLIPDDIETSRECFNRLAGIILGQDPKGADEIISFYADPKSFRDLLSGVLTQEYQFPDTFGGSQPVTLLAANETLRYLIKPIKENAERAGLPGTWSSSYCPVCGAPAHFSFIEGDEGRLTLSCSRCLMRWTFRRMTCPFCGEAGKEKTRYFTVENDPVRRVYVCETCKRYIKSVDSKERVVVFSRLEDVATIRLDIVAKREGYVRDTVDLVSVLAMEE
jgi:FdhE protein